MQTFSYKWPTGAWRGNETEAKAIRTSVPGLIIVVKGNDKRKYYTITHELSGLGCGDYSKLAYAQATAEALGYVLDWTQMEIDRTIAKHGESFRNYVRRIVRFRR